MQNPSTPPPTSKACPPLNGLCSATFADALQVLKEVKYRPQRMFVTRDVCPLLTGLAFDFPVDASLRGEEPDAFLVFHKDGKNVQINLLDCLDFGQLSKGKLKSEILNLMDDDQDMVMAKACVKAAAIFRDFRDSGELADLRFAASKEDMAKLMALVPHLATTSDFYPTFTSWSRTLLEPNSPMVFQFYRPETPERVCRIHPMDYVVANEFNAAAFRTDVWSALNPERVRALQERLEKLCPSDKPAGQAKSPEEAAAETDKAMAELKTAAENHTPKLKVINLYGGPGTGKSTTAAELFALMKRAGYRVELVTEYAKDLTYDKRTNTLSDQLYILAKQNARLSRLVGQADVVITDSPLLLGLVYAKPNYFPSYPGLMADVFDQYDNVNIRLIRDPEKVYSNLGRTQTEEEAKALDEVIYQVWQQQKKRFQFASWSDTAKHIFEVLKSTTNI